MHYLLILVADAFLATTFAVQKKYQSFAGTSARATLTFNAFVGLATAMSFTLLWLFGIFEMQFSTYSAFTALLLAVIHLTYMAFGFKLLRAGNMPLYTMFLMTGGMLVPYIFGLGFLDEKFSLLRFFGIILIVTAVVISNTGAMKPTKKQLAMCCAVFLLNGLMSVTSKIHQSEISAQLSPVNSESLTFIMSLVKIAICFPIAFTLIKKEKLTIAEAISSKAIPLFVLSALADSMSLYLQLIGATNIDAGVLYPLVTAGSIILSAFAGMIVFRERPTKNQWLSMAVCLAGTCMFI